MINHQWLEILISITNFHDPIDVQTIEIWLYFPWKQNKTTKKLSASILNCTLKVKLTMTDLLSIKSIIMHKSLLWEGNIIMLTFTTPWANSADDKLIFFLFFAENRIWHFMQIVSNRALRKHAYSNILKILPPKNENFQIKFLDIFHISA